MEFGRATKVNVWVIIGLIVGYLFIGWVVCAIMAFVYPEPQADDDTCYLGMALGWPIFLVLILFFGIYEIFQQSINAISISTYNKRKRKRKDYPPKE